jgi:hypothetical protein
MFKTLDRDERRNKIKKYLESAIYLRQEVKVKQGMLDDLQVITEKIRDEVIEGQISQLRDAFYRDITVLLVTLNRIKRMVDHIDHPRIRIIFEARYIKGMSWEDVSDLMFFSGVHTKRLADNGYSILADSIFADEL